MAQYKDKVGSLELIPGSGGAYEVIANGQLIFSKKKLGRYPEPQELEKQLGVRL